MHTGTLVVVGLIVGALVATTQLGTRGSHFLPPFILVSGFVIGVGMLVNRAVETMTKRRERKPK